MILRINFVCQQMDKLLKNYWPLFCLIFLEIMLFATNYKLGTYFLGWDNLFPEMNFSENLRRSFFGIWQEYRGLGLLDGMSFAANIPHYAFLYLLSLFLPISLLRYSFIFLMHFLGGVGVYFLTRELIGNHPKVKWISLFGAIFYLLNIGTVQMFFVPYELFTVHFAFVPLLILLVIKYLKSGLKKYLLYFFVLSFLSSPQAHVPTIFIVYLIALSCVLLCHLIFSGKKGLVKIAMIVILTFAANSFWGLPYIYSTFANASTITNSKINQMSTEEIYLKNKAYGDFTNVALMKGFSFDFIDTLSSEGYMMQAWRTHTQQPIFIIFGFALFGLNLVGILNSIKNKEKRFYPFIVMFLFSFLMLADNIPILGSVSSLSRNYIPYFDQLFRFTFTKFAILYAFVSAIFIGFGVVVLIDLASKVKHLDKVLWLFLFLVLGYYSLPSWEGNFLYQKQRLEIPKEYFSLVDFLKNQDKNSRVALIPQTSLWGWTYTKWGYQGSGFIWYGIPQATLDGAFYPWSRNNENYYWELTQAFFQKDKNLFYSVLDKYQIKWLVVDENLRSPLSKNSDYKKQIQEVIEKSDKINLEEKFGDIRVYRVNLSQKIQNFTFINPRLPTVAPSYQWGSIDQGYIENGNYISLENGKSDLYYPFRTLFTGRVQNELEFKITDNGEYFSFKTQIPKEAVEGKLIIPALKEGGFSNKPPEIFLDDELVQFDVSENSPTEVLLSYIKNGVLEVKVPKAMEYTNLEPAALNLAPKICNAFNSGVYQHERITEGGEEILKMTSIGSDNCLSLSVPNLVQKNGYLVKIKSQHIEGKSLLFALINQTSNRADLEINLPKNNIPQDSYFIVPPMELGGVGYTFYFDNVSYGSLKTVNNLGRIIINPIPYQFLTSLKVTTRPINHYPSNINITTDHPNPSLYDITVDEKQLEKFGNAAILVLSQSFDSGWKAYNVKDKGVWNSFFPFIFGQELKQHILVNNWENGWVINNAQIVIVYLPQYLEYLGFLIVFATFLWFAFWYLLNIYRHKRI